MGQPGGKGHVLSNTAPRPGAPVPAANQRQREKVSREKTTGSVCVYNSKMPQFRKLGAEELSQGQGHQLFAKLVWRLLFPLVYGNDCMQRSLHATPMLMAILSVVVFPSRGQRSLPSCKKASLHPPILLCFALVGKGLFLKLFCVARVLSMNQVLKFISAC